MKNLFVYYLVILLPLVAIAFLTTANLINSTSFFVLLLSYVFVFRTIVDGKKLADNSVILQKDIWKMIIPGNRAKYFKELYLK